MPTATRDVYSTTAKLPKLRTGYQITLTSPSPSTPSSRSAMSMGGTRELPMPTVSRITSLTQAQATLQHCATKLSRSWQNPARSSPPSSPIDAYGKRHFQQWLEQWEQAFTAYLSFAMPGMKSEDITRSRILKANHLSCTILASDGRSFNTFDQDFQAIVDLAGAIMQSRAQKADGSSRADPSTLDVREPLYVVVARCNRVTTRNQAMELLNILSSR